MAFEDFDDCKRTDPECWLYECKASGSKADECEDQICDDIDFLEGWEIWRIETEFGFKIEDLDDEYTRKLDEVEAKR